MVLVDSHCAQSHQADEMARNSLIESEGFWRIESEDHILMSQTMEKVWNGTFPGATAQRALANLTEALSPPGFISGQLADELYFL